MINITGLQTALFFGWQCIVGVSAAYLMYASLILSNRFKFIHTQNHSEKDTNVDATSRRSGDLWGLVTIVVWNRHGALKNTRRWRCASIYNHQLGVMSQILGIFKHILLKKHHKIIILFFCHFRPIWWYKTTHLGWYKTTLSGFIVH